MATQQYSLANNTNLAGVAVQQSSDSHLLSAAKKGDKAAFGQLFERCLHGRRSRFLVVAQKIRVLQPNQFFAIDGTLNPEDSFAEQERAKMLHSALAGLRPRVRAAIEICQLQECSVRETARKLGISTAAAKGRLFHARVALRKACTQKTNPAFARRLRRAA